MKKYLFAMLGLLAFPAVAEISPAQYFGYADEYADEVEPIEETAELESASTSTAPVAAKPVNINPRATINRNVARGGGAVPGVQGATRPADRSGNTVQTRAVASRSAVPVTTAGNIINAQGSGAQTSRAMATGGSASAMRSAAGGAQAVPAQNAPTAQATTPRQPIQNVNTARSGVTQAAGGSLYTPANTERSGIARGTPIRRNSSIGGGSLGNSTARSAEGQMQMSGPTMEEIAQLSDFCRAQYFSCMDGYCAVLDDNQGRCSCSASVTKYRNLESTLKQATEELQDVARKIQYIGLTKDEVISLFSATEAEAAMAGTVDSTQNAADIARIGRLVLDLKPTSATFSDEGLSLDFEMSFDSDFGFDLGSLFNFGGGGNIINMRGAELYKSASTQCKRSVLENCRRQGVDTTILSNSYDLEIDRQCIVYERSLDDANTNMRRTVKNAKTVLERARLAVAQSKNMYDMKGCVNALDACMQNDFVCGSDYENCLDPTGKFIVNGALVPGSMPGNFDTVTSPASEGIYKVWSYGTSRTSANPWLSGNGAGTIDDMLDKLNELTPSDPAKGFDPHIPQASVLLVSMMNKIGWVNEKDGKSHGMCISVLNKCQNVSFRGPANRRVFKPDNMGTKEFLKRVFFQIKTKQDEVIASHAENCVMDVITCLNQNSGGKQDDARPQSIARDACRSISKTCLSVTRGTVTSNSASEDNFMDEMWCQNKSGTWVGSTCTITQ
ncbi:MAG: hypothetical protein FWG80_00310 [Alphaproteobacteria bacterium]|nr:hypothetical protein [Alphaproteobacteria bacterium]